MVGIRFPAVVVHSLADARAALAPGRPITLLSGEGAALYAGCAWWQALVHAARAEFPQAAHVAFPQSATMDLLDCADAPGQALAALRIGLRHLVLRPEAPGWAQVAAIVAGLDGVLLRERPPALDLADPGSHRRLHEWVQAGTGPDDRRDSLR